MIPSASIFIKSAFNTANVTWLLFPKQGSQSNRQPLLEHLLEHDGQFHDSRTVSQHVGQNLGRLPATERLRLVEDIQLLMVRQIVGLQ